MDMQDWVISFQIEMFVVCFWYSFECFFIKIMNIEIFKHEVNSVHYMLNTN